MSVPEGVLGAPVTATGREPPIEPGTAASLLPAAVSDKMRGYLCAQLVESLSAREGPAELRAAVASKLVAELIQTSAREEAGLLLGGAVPDGAGQPSSPAPALEQQSKKRFLKRVTETSEGVAKCLRMSESRSTLAELLLRPADDIYAEHRRHRQRNKQIFQSIQGLHSALFDSPWEATVADTANLQEYAGAAALMGGKQWVAAGNQWMVNFSRDFYSGGYALRKYRRSARGESGGGSGENETVDPFDCNPDTLQGRPVRLCDVGSCYNPFKDVPGFATTALDLCPAHASVLQCDFLALEVGDRDSAPVVEEVEEVEEVGEVGQEGRKKLIQLPRESFDAVTMSLVLNYLPTPEMRGEMIARARQLLAPASRSRPHVSGLLLIAEKESIFSAERPLPPNHLVDQWTRAIEAAGFRRLTHQLLRSGAGRCSHVFAFRRVELPSSEPTVHPLITRQDVVYASKSRSQESTDSSVAS